MLPSGLFALLESKLHPVTVTNGHAALLHHGQDAFARFRFCITHSRLEASQTAAGTFTYDGPVDEAEQALLTAGFRRRRGAHAGQREFRTRGHWLTGADSAHFLLFELPLHPGNPGRTQGEFHFGEHTPYSPLGWLFHWLLEAHR